MNPVWLQEEILVLQCIYGNDSLTAPEVAQLFITEIASYFSVDG
jgi:hypothetical protein